MVSLIYKNESYQIKKFCSDKLWAMKIIPLIQLPSTLIILMMIPLSDNHIPQRPYTVSHSTQLQNPLQAHFAFSYLSKNYLLLLY